MKNKTLRTALQLLMFFLLIISVPWYRPPGTEPKFYLGMPDWVALALTCYALVIFINLLLWLRKDEQGKPTR
ncbi:hypothetical protein [Endozoicomonas numazuensis]|uniref:Uncharacterized protein n=1 Tax=Endozoicomonas numazuensis TaxID=1137799 RepID=A0A081N6M5_9GAMM|nr:hypothetical protein [Endozoicomonas numazuensis]KEQ14098.1 hypothetical protein GZ78_26105 [Endozoicomonas numazuensis]